MRVVDRLAQREQSWRELEMLLDRLANVNQWGKRPPLAVVVRLGELYRAACTDLMLAETHDLPRDTVNYLHSLVGRAHNAVYRVRGFKFQEWAAALFDTAPRQLRSDPALRLSALTFFGTFLICALLAAGRPGFAAKVATESFVDQVERMYSEPLTGTRKDGMSRSDPMMAGFYIQHNTSIGLKCFAGGLLFGLGTLFELLSEGMVLGAIFGHMARSPYAGNFFTFVTAHSVFELSAVAFAGAAGLRLGWGLIDTKGQTRLGSLQREAKRALPTVGTSVVLFVMAAFIEGFVSASALPYPFKAGIALLSLALLSSYLLLLGRSDRWLTTGR